MPTASTAQILGNNECFEPFTSNIYVRRVLSGEFPIVNKYLVRDLIKLGLWNEELRSDIIAANVIDLIERSDDPAKMIRVIILEMEETLVEVRASAARLIADDPREGGSVVEGQGPQRDPLADVDMVIGNMYGVVHAYSVMPGGTKAGVAVLKSR